MTKTLLLLWAALLALPAVAAADLIDTFAVPIGGEVGPGQTIFLGTETTGILFTNLSQGDAFVSIELIEEPPRRPNDLVAGGFELIDGTLRISSNIPNGEKRVRIRMGYTEQRILRRGLRAGSQRLFRRMRFGRRAMWGRAVRAIRGRATLRRFAPSAPVPGLGHYGFDDTDSFVWAFVDVTSDYAIAARRIPEPASLFLLVGGLGLVLWSGRRKE